MRAPSSPTSHSAFLSNAAFNHSFDDQQSGQGSGDSVVYGTFKSAPSTRNRKVSEDDENYSGLKTVSCTSTPYSPKGMVTPVQMHTILTNGITDRRNIDVQNMATNKDIDPRLNQIEKLTNIHDVLPALTDDGLLHLIPYDVEGSSGFCCCKSEDHAVLIVVYRNTIILIDPKDKDRDYGINARDIPAGFNFSIHKLDWQGSWNATNCGHYTAHLAIRFATDSGVTINPGFFNLDNFVAALPKKHPSLERIKRELSGYYLGNSEEEKI